MSLVLLGILNSQAAGGGAAAAYDLLETTVLSSDTSSVTFSNLNNYSDYKHLQLRIVGKDGWATSGQSFISMRFNGVSSGTPYRYKYIYSWIDNGTGRAVSGGPADQIELFTGLATSTRANSYSGAIIDILDFSNSSKNTTIRAFTGAIRGDGGSNNRVAFHSAIWNSTSSVTSILLQSLIDVNLKSGSRLSLYGIKA